MVMRITQAGPDRGRPAASPAQEICLAAGLTEQLPELLLHDEAGVPFEPTSLAASDTLADLPEQWALLMRPEPVGGAEPVVQARAAVVMANAHARLRVGAGGLSAGARPLLEGLCTEARDIRELLAGAAAEADAAFAQAHEPLRAWQRASARELGLLRGAASWLFGGPERLALPQAVALWNERERAAARRAACHGAVALLSRFADDVAALLERQGALGAEARRLSAALSTRADLLAVAEAGYAPWSWRVEVKPVAAALADEVPYDDLLADVLGDLLAGGDEVDLAVSVAERSRAAAADLLSGLTLARCIELEAGGASRASDPVVLVGRRLLELVTGSPSWLLARGAHPRCETLQLTADGAPLFALDGLGAASYGDRIDRFGFIQVELGVAVDELRAGPDEAEAFAQLQRRRNLYILEELAAAPAEDEAPPIPSIMSNGHAPGDGQSSERGTGGGALWER